MSAIEYGSYYWCVVLNGTEKDAASESVHLHADEVAVDGTGCLVFKSAGRRPAGADPNKPKENADEKDSGKNDTEEKEPKDGKEGEDAKAEKKGNMIYVAFAPGSWKAFFAAKLQDGMPASIEHWNSSTANHAISNVVPPNSGAAGYIPKN
jgi:hypothetical protein